MKLGLLCRLQRRRRSSRQSRLLDRGPRYGKVARRSCNRYGFFHQIVPALLAAMIGAVLALGVHRVLAAELAGDLPRQQLVAPVGLAQVHQERPGFFDAVAQMVRVPIIPGLGSTLVRRDGAVLGAVGVSGGKPEQDLECAEAGLRAVAK